MRTARVLSLLVPPALLVAASLAACDDASDGTSSGGFESEGGSFEASPGPDGAAADTSPLPDGARPDGAMGTGVSVVVGDTAKPQADVRVIFQDASGAILGEAKTDAAGMAVSTALPSMVTVLYAPPAQASEAVTFLGVNDGDTLNVVPSPQFGTTSPGDISVTFTPDALTRKAPFIYAYTSRDNCRNSTGNPATPAVIHLTPDCAHASNTIFGEADDAATTQGFALAKGVLSPSGGSVVSVGPLTFTPAGTRTLIATNLPSTDSPEGRAWAVSGTDMHFLPPTDSTITDPAGLGFYAPRDSIDAFQSAVSTSHEVAGGASFTEIIQRETATTAATGAFGSMNFATALPYVTGVNATAAVRPDVTITMSSAPSAAAAYVMIAWGAEDAQTWTFVMPGTTTSFKVPAIPADATAFTPSGPVIVEAVGYLDGALLPSYAALKALPIPTETFPALMDDQQPLPANGLVKLSTYQRIND